MGHGEWGTDVGGEEDLEEWGDEIVYALDIAAFGVLNCPDI